MCFRINCLGGQRRNPVDFLNSQCIEQYLQTLAADRKVFRCCCNHNKKRLLRCFTRPFLTFNQNYSNMTSRLYRLSSSSPWELLLNLETDPSWGQSERFFLDFLMMSPIKRSCVDCSGNELNGIYFHPE